MNILVGIDTLETSRPALELIQRLGFEETQLHLAHSMEPLAFTAPAGAGVGPGYISPDLADQQVEIGRRVLAEAAALYPQATTHLLNGSATEALMTVGDRIQADLIAIGSMKRHPIDAALLGSTGRSLAINSRRSFLVAKNGGNRGADQPVTAVFATDHSKYADLAADLLCDFKPRGLEKLMVVTSLRDRDGMPIAFPELAPWGKQGEDWLKDEVAKRSRALCERFESAGISADFEVTDAHPASAISAAMKAFEADLSIMGSVGHGFLHRLFLGSTAMHQVVSEPWSVLVLRPAQE
jgi:nucleotide-binding universal stress UspA family protein